MAETNFWKIENGKPLPLDYGTETINETSKYTPIGAYTSFRTYGRFGVLRLEKHLDRLEETSRLAGHEIHLDREQLKGILTDLIANSPDGEKRLRITIDLENEIGAVYIAMEPLSVPSPEKYEKGIVCCTAEAHRENPKAKLSNFLSRADGIRSREQGPFDEILMYNDKGNLLEGLSSNFYGVTGDTVYTADEGVLSGTTRDFILKIASELNIPVRFEPVRKADIAKLDEAFISSTSRAILPVRTIDGIAMQKEVPGPVTRQLTEKFNAELSAHIESLSGSDSSFFPNGNGNQSPVTLMIDSGVGGLSVLALAHQRLPKENFRFFADAGNAPYGDKSPQEIRDFLHKILDRYKDVPLKAILLACNTATSAAAAVLRNELSLPVIGMEPALKPAVLSSEGQIIVMATSLTIREEKFQKLLAKYGEGRDIVPLACPGLMQLVENGPAQRETEDYIRDILGPYKDSMRSIVLGCTHYVFLRPLIRRLFPDVMLFDGNDGVVRHLEDILCERKTTGGEGTVEIDCSLTGPEKDQYLEKCKDMLDFCSEMYQTEDGTKG